MTEHPPLTLTATDRIAEDRMRVIRALLERLATGIERVLTRRMVRESRITLAGVEEMGFSTYASQLNRPCCAFIYRLGDPEDSAMIIELGPELPYATIERLYGGTGELIQQDKTLSEPERTTLQEMILDEIASRFQEVWENHLEFQPRYQGYDATPEAIDAIEPEADVVVGLFDARLHSGDTRISICIPKSVLHPFLSGATDHRLSRDMVRRGTATDEQKLWIWTHLLEAPYRVQVRFPRVQTTVRRLRAAARPGHFLLTGLESDGAVELFVGRKAIAIAEPASDDRYLGFRITQVWRESRVDLQSPVGGLVYRQTEEGIVSADPDGFDTLDEVPVSVQLVLVEVERTGREVKELAPGSLIRTPKSVNEPAIVLVNGRPFAEGKPIDVEGQIGLEITRVLRPDAPARGDGS